jgi:hypothetical protein
MVHAIVLSKVVQCITLAPVLLTYSIQLNMVTNIYNELTLQHASQDLQISIVMHVFTELKLSKHGQCALPLVFVVVQNG